MIPECKKDCDGNCTNCNIAEEVKNYYLDLHESIFDAVNDYREWQTAVDKKLEENKK